MDLNWEMNEADLERGWVQDEIQEDTTSMEEKLEALAQNERCERGACYTKDVVDGRCKHCGRQDDPCTHPKGDVCSTCQPT